MTKDNVEQQMKECRSEVRRLSRLLEVSRLIYSEMEMEKLFPTVIDDISTIMGADRASLFVVDHIKEEVWTMVAQGAGAIHLSIYQGIIGWVARTGKSALINDPVNDHRFYPHIDKMLAYKTKNVVAVPLKNHRGTTIGVLEIMNKKRGNFNGNDLDFAETVGSQLAIALENAELYDSLKKTFESIVDVLALTIDERHPGSRGHSRRVAAYAEGIAREMRLSEERIEIIKLAALLHDYGKISIPDEILKKNGKLSAEEYEIMKRHALMTYEILSKVHFAPEMSDIPTIAYLHHENWDGKGYPFGKKGKEIPLGARIIAVADVFDAITTTREYHDSQSAEYAVDYIKNHSGTQFDPDVVEAFARYYTEELLYRDATKSHGKTAS